MMMIMMMLTDSGVTAAVIKSLDDKHAGVWTTADDVTAPRDNRDDRRVYRGSAAESLRQSRHHDVPAAMPSFTYAYGHAATTTAAPYHCDCDVCRHCSTSTSLYPMIGSCTTSSCHVDSRPRPPLPPYTEMFVDGSGSTLTDCSTCCVYEYALDLDSLRTDLERDSGSERTVDCSSAVKGASLSWLTVHSAPAVLGRLTRYKLPASHRHLHNCTTVRHGRERHEPYRRETRDGFCGCHSPVCRTNTTCYQPVPYTYRCSVAAADVDADNDAYRRLSPSLRVAKPVLAETQFWV